MTYKSQTVSAIVITENNALTIEKALSSLHWVDELIVLDRGSTDGTLAIARAFTDHVHFHPARNKTILRRDALSLGHCDWLFLVEPDEWVEEMLRHEIDGMLLNTPANLNGYTIPRMLRFQNQWVTTPIGEEPTRQLRLVRKKHWEVKEDWAATLTVGGDVGKLDRPLGYAPYRTVEELFTDVNSRSTLAAYHHLEVHGVSPKDQGAFGLVIKTKLTAWSQFLLRGGMFKGITGQTIAMANTVGTFLKFAKVRTLTKK